jgi:hypothetical protein
MTSSKKINLYRHFAAGVYLSEAPEPLTPLPLHTVYVNTVYLFKQGRGGGGGRVEPERRLEGHCDKHLPQSSFTGHIAFGVYVVN